MQAVSPQILHSESSPGDSISQGPNIQDPYLYAPSDPDEDDFRSTGIRLTPPQGEGSNQHLTPVSSSPSDLPINGSSARGIDWPVDYSDSAGLRTGSYHNFLSPSDLSSNTSPSDVPLTGDLGVNLDPRQKNWERGLPVPISGVHSHVPGAAGPSTFTTPSEAQLALHNALNSSHPGHQLAPLATDAKWDNLSAQGSLDPDSARARSPIVKIESYSRGDSPVRDSHPSVRRQSRSPAYLSPGNANESSSESGDEGKGPESDNPILRAPDGSWIPNVETGHSGVDPASRTAAYVPSPNDMETRRQLEDKNEDIRSWSVSVSAANSETGDEAPGLGSRPRIAGNRRRAVSAGDPSRQQDYFSFKLHVSDSKIPGPGLLLHESSNDGFSEHESEIGSKSGSPGTNVNPTGLDRTTSENAAHFGKQSKEIGESAPSQWLPQRDQQDLLEEPSPQMIRTQPESSNAAISAFNERAKDLETASRVATWGTERLAQSLDKMSIHDKNKVKERRPSLFANAANNLKRQLSHISITHSHGENRVGSEGTEGPHRKDSFPLPRKLSIGNIGKSHQRSPSLSTQSAVIAIAGQMAAIGGRGSVGAAHPSGGVSPRSIPQRNRQRSRSEIPKGSVPSLAELMTCQGGPPVTRMAYLTKAAGNNATQMESDAGPDARDDDDGDEDIDDDRGLVMDFPSISSLPVPTLEGFRAQVAQLNPRLGQYLIDRFANEQLRRYKALVELKSSHSRVASQNKCIAGKHCFVQGGDATLLPHRANPQDTDSASTQFQNPQSDDKTLGDGAVSSAQFPNGVPLPPVSRLPAEFECPVCFKVRKFQKPSDWTKHIHEDLQPFTCTFEDCNEPKSFKRKADWVRHENERHRKLEWWTCSIADCQHTCYRKNNFVQHLVREHKMPDPGVKKSMEEASRREQELERLWALVERCRHDTPRTARDEPCRFCGNICSSWKKLTVHLAKHMEQISLPVLQLVKERDFPIDAGAGAVNGAPPISGPTINMDEPSSLGLSQDAVQNSSAVSLDIGQGEYTNMITMQNGVMSAEPEQIESYDMTQYPQFDIPGASGPSVNQTGYSHLLSEHQSSVTYPPPFNAVPRPRASNQEMGVVQGPYEVFVHPPEMGLVYSNQTPLYMSPAAGSSFAPNNPVAQPMPYEPSDGANYSKDQGADYM